MIPGLVGDEFVLSQEIKGNFPEDFIETNPKNLSESPIAKDVIQSITHKASVYQECKRGRREGRRKEE